MRFDSVGTRLAIHPIDCACFKTSTQQRANHTQFIRLSKPQTNIVQRRVVFLRKEVIQPLVLERLPCYDFTPVIGFALGKLCPTSGAPNFHGVTGGVYKTRERIHRDVLIRDY